MLPTKLIKKMESALMQSVKEPPVEWVDAEEARKLLGRGGKELKKYTLSRYVSMGKIPPSFYTKSPNGKIWFNKQKLLGL